MVAHEGIQQCGFRFAAIAVIGQLMRTDKDRVEVDSLGGEQGHGHVLGRLKIVLRKRVCAEPVLVGHHHEFETGVAQFE